MVASVGVMPLMRFVGSNGLEVSGPSLLSCAKRLASLLLQDDAHTHLGLRVLSASGTELVATLVFRSGCYIASTWIERLGMNPCVVGTYMVSQQGGLVWVA